MPSQGAGVPEGRGQMFNADLLQEDGLEWRSVGDHDLDRLIVVDVLRDLLPDVVRQLQNL